MSIARLKSASEDQAFPTLPAPQEGMRLIRAFLRIEDRSVREEIIRLVEAIDSDPSSAASCFQSKPGKNRPRSWDGAERRSQAREATRSGSTMSPRQGDIGAGPIERPASSGGNHEAGAQRASGTIARQSTIAAGSFFLQFDKYVEVSHAKTPLPGRPGGGVRPHCVQAPQVTDAESFKLSRVSQSRRLPFVLPALLQHSTHYAIAAGGGVSILTDATCGGHGEGVTARTAPTKMPRSIGAKGWLSGLGGRNESAGPINPSSGCNRAPDRLPTHALMKSTKARSGAGISRRLGK